MWYQFILENSHFAINMFAALVFLAVAWLHFDAWLESRAAREGFRFLGFVILAVSFVAHAVLLESAVLASPVLNGFVDHQLFLTTRVFGYFLILLSLLIDPLQEQPKTVGLTKDAMFNKQFAMAGLLSFSPMILSSFTLAPLACGIGFLYLRKATVGLENHLKPVGLAFLALGLFELLHLSSLFETTNSPDLYNLVASFGPIWLLAHLVELVAVLLLARWVFFYLLKRVLSQLMMIFASAILVIFLTITVAFTFLILNSLETETLNRLETDVKVLNFGLDSQKAERAPDALLLSQSPALVQALVNKSSKDLADLAENSLVSKKESLLVIVDENGQVLARGEDRERVGDSIGSDSLIKQALQGEAKQSVVKSDGVLAPQISIRSAAPVKLKDKTIGAVMVGSVIDNAFVDGLKKATSLETSVYGADKLSATTLVAAGGKSRFIGLKVADVKVRDQVLGKGQPLLTSVQILNIPYFAAYLPLKDMNNQVVGMLFVGKPQIGVLQSAARSIELTFIIAALLLLFFTIPSYLISNYISYQFK